MSISEDQRKEIVEIIATELDQRSLSLETRTEDTKRRVLLIMEEASDSATYIGARAHDWLVYNLDLLRPRTEHRVTGMIRTAG